MSAHYTGPERRKFVRLEYVSPLAYKVCRQDTITKLFKGYTADVSEAGLQCKIKDKVHKDDLLWLSFDRSILTVCSEMEHRCFIYQNGVIGKVVRVEPHGPDAYLVGVHFLIREEQNLTHIISKIQLLQLHPERAEVPDEEDQE